MTQERPADRLMEKLLRAIEVSLKATEASREAVQEILRRGAARVDRRDSISSTRSAGLTSRTIISWREETSVVQPVLESG